MKFKEWKIFIRERFDPLVYTVTVFLFLTAHYAVYLRWNDAEISWFYFSTLFLAAIVFFLKLRLYDEIKDYEHDVAHYPDRPLPRGLLKHKDLHVAIIFIIFLETGLFLVLGIKALISILPAILYSLLMYKEFFARKWLRGHLSAYAISHTAVIVLFSLAIFSALYGDFLWDMNKKAMLFSFASWFIFNVFEFGRKTLASDEERPGIDSYSKIHGRHGAVALAGATITIASLLFGAALGFSYIFIILPLLLMFCGVLYITLNNSFWGNLYRISTAIYIPAIYGSIILGL